MTSEELKVRNFENEFVFSSSRSSGPGGQNVNKVNSKVELRFNLFLTTLLSDLEKEIIFKKLKNKINKDGELLIISQSERSQLLNKNVVTERFYFLISKTLTIQKHRRATKPTYASKLKRLDEKKSHSSIKKLRKKSGSSDQ